MTTRRVPPRHARPRRVQACRDIRSPILACVAVVATAVFLETASAQAGTLLAGAAKADISDPEAGPAATPPYVKALVLRNDETMLAIIAVDAVAVAEIGRLGNDYLPTVRARLEQELDIDPGHVLVSASHCHAAVCADVADRTVQAVMEATRNLTPVRAGAGAGYEDRVMENRRYRLKDGGEADSRHAYALPPDEWIAGVGPVDPEIGVLRLDKPNGQALAAVYHFACHPIQGAPGGGNTADITGFASQVIEENLGEGAVSLFLQGCAGDINPVFYKDIDHPRDAEPLGNLLGLSALRALRGVQCRDDSALRVIRETIALPLADWAPRIAALEARKTRLLQSLKGTSLNLRSFLHLTAKHGLSSEFPSYYVHGYLHEEGMGRDDLLHLDAENRENMRQYAENVYIMEELTRLQTNLDLLRKHQAYLSSLAGRTIDVEILGVRIGEFVLVTFPGEPTVQIGLNIKALSPHELTFVAGCTNGYIYYAPTAEQLRNSGYAQEDCDCILAPEWQHVFEEKVAALLQRL